MPKDMFGDVVEPSIKVGSQAWYTVPVSIFLHVLLLGGVIIVPLPVSYTHLTLPTNREV